MTKNPSSINADQLRVTVEMGDDYQPSDRLAAALAELSEALIEDGDDVAGFSFEPLRSFVVNIGMGTHAFYQADLRLEGGKEGLATGGPA